MKLFAASIVTLLALSAVEAHTICGGDDQGEVITRTTVGRAKENHSEEHTMPPTDGDSIYGGAESSTNYRGKTAARDGEDVDGKMIMPDSYDVNHQKGPASGPNNAKSSGRDGEDVDGKMIMPDSYDVNHQKGPASGPNNAKSSGRDGEDVDGKYTKVDPAVFDRPDHNIKPVTGPDTGPFKFSGRDGAPASCYIEDSEAASQCVDENDWKDPASAGCAWYEYFEDENGPDKRVCETLADFANEGQKSPCEACCICKYW
ncbi:unnamed protein product [Cylindrotheca closterium]|uniref:Uncharacterized protein n=1 Tax=Cylindrotheca closterium TaxID=2856 RepID=A0AAD2CMV9_9STRA|nr:unnamed protein product [Cylindrotheca closterium]